MRTCGRPPGRLPGEGLLARFVREADAESLREALAELVAGTHLEGFAIADHGFGGPGCGGAGEAFAFGLAPEQHGDRHHVDHEVGVDVSQYPQGVIVRLPGGGVSCMAFLPQELGRSQEEPWAKFPAHHVCPLVDEQRQVTVALGPFGEERVYDRLARGAHDDRLLELLAAPVRHHCQLGAEAFDVLRLAAEIAFGDQEREVGVLGPAALMRESISACMRSHMA